MAVELGQDLVRVVPGSGPAPLWADPLRDAVSQLAARTGRLRAPLSIVTEATEVEPEDHDWRDESVVVVIDRLEPVLADTTNGEQKRRSLVKWMAKGARIAVPSGTGARALESSLSLSRGAVVVAPIPHPRREALVDPGPPPDAPHLLAVRPPYEVFFPALRALWALAGERIHSSIAADDARPYLAPGGLSQWYGFLGGVDVGALAEWRDTSAEYSMIVWFPAELDAGHELREAIATGRPVIVPTSPILNDHIRACGAPVYTFAGLHDPIGLAEAVQAALHHGRGRRMGERARMAVLEETWVTAASRIVDAVAPRPRRALTTPRRSASDRLSIALIDAQGSDGGGERLLGEIVEGLCRHPSRPDVRLVCIDDPEVNFSPPLRRARAAGATVVGATRDEAPELALAEVERADVGWYIWAQTAEVPDVGTPIVATIHDVAWRHFDIIGGIDPTEAERIVTAWGAHARAVSCSSEFIRRDLAAVIPDAADRIAVVPLAAPRADRLPTLEEIELVRRRYSLPGRFILSPAPRSRHKNYAVLVAALASLRREGRPVTVIATGSGTDTHYWGPDLIGLGYVPSSHLATIRALAAGVVQTTLYEAGSFPVFEAMMSGIPVACSRIEALVEQLERDGTFAETFDPTDPAELAAALRAIFWPSSDLIGRFSKNALLVRRRSWIDVAADYLDLLERVAGTAGTLR